MSKKPRTADDDPITPAPLPEDATLYKIENGERVPMTQAEIDSLPNMPVQQDQPAPRTN